MILSLIASYAEDKDGAKVIGRNNQIPWYFPHDLERFKEYTLDSAVIMGRKTHESIGRILPRRDNIIVTRQSDYVVSDAFVFNDLEEAIQFASLKHVEIFVIGGQQLYEQTIDRAARLYLTSFKIKDIEGDVYFPVFDIGLYRTMYVEESGISEDCFRILEKHPPRVGPGVSDDDIGTSPRASSACPPVESTDTEGEYVCEGGSYTI